MSDEAVTVINVLRIAAALGLIFVALADGPLWLGITLAVIVVAGLIWSLIMRLADREVSKEYY